MPAPVASPPNPDYTICRTSHHSQENNTKTRSLLAIPILLLFLAPVACAPARQVTPTPTLEPTPVIPTATPTAVPPTAIPPTPTTTPAAVFAPDPKYAGVYVYTVEEQANDGRSLLNVAYPVLENPAINASLRTLSESFIDEWRVTAASQEAAYQDYVSKTGEVAASIVTDYVQHFDVTLADDNLISLSIERYRFTGGTGSTEVRAHIFDRRAGTELAPADLFTSDAYLERLSSLARQELERRAQAEAAEAHFDTPALREEWLANMLAMVRAGTEPLPENFDGLLFHEDGTLRIQFDKYQVGPGSSGVVEVILPVESLADLLTPNMRHLLSTVNPGLEAAATPMPTPAPTPGSASSSVDCGVELCVALTFDDGPSIYTEGLLDILAQHHAHATFFVLGKSAKVQARTIIRMAQEGHEIGNHSWSHLSMKGLSAEEIRAQVDPTNELVTEITGTAPRYFRPPYGRVTDDVLAAVPMPVILWNLDPLDWQDRNADLVAERLSQASNGGILLSHDIFTSTVQAMPAVLTSLSVRGIHLVTVSQLMAPTVPQPGKVYGRRPTR